MSPALPLADPLAPAAPPLLFAVLLQLLFFLHVLAMNVMLGGALLVAHWRLGRPGPDAAHRESVLRFVEGALPVAMAATVTLGVAALLFAQALHGRVFFTSTILMAWLWLAIVPLAILAYYGAYTLAYARGSAAARRWVTAAVALLLGGIAFLQVTNASRSLRPDTFADVHRLDPRGLALHLSDPSFWPRYLHVLLGAVAVAALFVALAGARWRRADPGRAAWAARRGLSVFAVATAANVLVGLAFLLALPKAVLIRLVGGGDRYSIAVLAAAILTATALAGAALLALGAKRAERAVVAVVALLLPTLATMVLLREELRRIVFADAGLEALPAARPQWAAFSLFAVLLVAGLATIAWMARALARGRAVVPLLVAAAFLLPACRQKEAPAGAPARYELKGQVLRVDRAERTVTITHEDIPGFMPAMTMDFVVRGKDAALLDVVGPGDEVSAVLVVPDSRYWIEELVVVKKGTGTPPPAAEPHAHGLEKGQALPDVELVDQDGRAFRLAEMKGRAYAATLVFTRCPLPDYCPLMMRHFAAAESILVADARLREVTTLLTVSFDTKHDTPEVLRAFGLPFQKTKPPFARWRLATGSDAAIRELATALDLDYEETSGSFTHNLRTAVVDPQGRLAHLFRGNEWKPEELVAQLRNALP